MGFYDGSPWGEIGKDFEDTGVGFKKDICEILPLEFKSAFHLYIRSQLIRISNFKFDFDSLISLWAHVLVFMFFFPFLP